MANSEILQAVARREMTPEMAVEIMLESDRPKWIPKWLWNLL